MLEISNNSLVPSILALQFVAFGWRINREIPVGDSGRKTWFPMKLPHWMATPFPAVRQTLTPRRRNALLTDLRGYFSAPAATDATANRVGVAGVGNRGPKSMSKMRGDTFWRLP